MLKPKINSQRVFQDKFHFVGKLQFLIKLIHKSCSLEILRLLKFAKVSNIKFVHVVQYRYVNLKSHVQVAKAWRNGKFQL